MSANSQGPQLAQQAPQAQNASNATEGAKAYLRQVAGFQATNYFSREAVRQARYEAWATILLEAGLTLQALVAYEHMLEFCYGRFGSCR